MSDVTSEASTRASADTNLQNQVNSLNSSVSNGKTQVANAITGKGIAASGSDSFATLANKISQISSKDASEYKNAKSYLCNSNSGGDFLVPALGYTPSLFLCFMKRAIDESNYCPAALCDFLRNKNDSTLGFDHTNTNSLFSGYVDDSSTYTSSIPAETYAAHTVRVARPYEWQYHYEYSQVYLTVIF